jgi:hypothetical protein
MKGRSLSHWQPEDLAELNYQALQNGPFFKVFVIYRSGAHKWEEIASKHYAKLWYRATKGTVHPSQIWRTPRSMSLPPFKNTICRCLKIDVAAWERLANGLRPAVHLPIDLWRHIISFITHDDRPHAWFLLWSLCHISRLAIEPVYEKYFLPNLMIVSMLPEATIFLCDGISGDGSPLFSKYATDLTVENSEGNVIFHQTCVVDSEITENSPSGHIQVHRSSSGQSCNRDQVCWPPFTYQKGYSQPRLLDPYILADAPQHSLQALFTGDSSGHRMLPVSVASGFPDI